MVPKSFQYEVNSPNRGLDGEKGRCRKGGQKRQSADGVSFQGSELVRVHPLVGTLILEAHSLHQLICLCGTAAAIDIRDGLGLLSINLVQQWCEDTPGFPEFITEGIQYRME